MAGQIRITPDQMRERANQYRTEADNVGTVIQHSDSLLNSLQEEWEGNSAQAYAGRYQELRPSFVKMQSLITEIGQSLDATAQSMEETDSNIAAQFRG